VPASLPYDAARHQEDSGSDHRADHDENQVAKAEHAGEGTVRQEPLRYHLGPWPTCPTHPFAA